MKKGIIALLMLFAIGFTACSEESGEDNAANKEEVQKLDSLSNELEASKKDLSKKKEELKESKEELKKEFGLE